MNTDLTIWWRRTVEVALLVAAMAVVCVFARAEAGAVLPVIVGLIGLALGVGQSPVSTVSTTIKTVHPPALARVDTIPSPPPDMLPPPPTLPRIDPTIPEEHTR